MEDSDDKGIRRIWTTMKIARVLAELLQASSFIKKWVVGIDNVEAVTLDHPLIGPFQPFVYL